MERHIASEMEGSGFYVAQFKTPQLAIFSYYVESEGQAVLIDPTFDTKEYQDILDKRKSTLQYVFLTHYHADFLSGHTQLKAQLVMGKNAKRQANQFALHEAEDGEQVKLGSAKLEVIHTPGHTLESSCFLLYDKEHVPAAIFTGDTVFMGDVGRPDLAANSTLTKNDLAGLLYDSVQKLKKYPGDIRLYPAHGAGSACGKAIKSGNFCSLGEQKKSNYGFTVADKESFVKQVTCIAEPPKYFFYDSAVNQTGSVVYEEIKKRVSVPLSLEQFRELSQKSPIVDTRVEIGRGLIKGAYWLPASGAITAWLSGLLTPETTFLLFCEEGQFEEVADRLLRIGYFGILGYNKFTIDEWPEEVNSPRIIGFEEFKQLKDTTHIDVRNIPEFQSTGIAESSLAIPLPQLPSRVSELSGKENIVVSCRTGLRARVAFSVLAREGLFPSVFIEHFEHFAQNGIKVVPFLK